MEGKVAEPGDGSKQELTRTLDLRLRSPKQIKAIEKNGVDMVDPRKSAEAARKIQDTQHTILNHQANISKIERDKSDRNRYFDQQIKHEQDKIKQLSKQIEDLKRQI
jgi:hypothetical protein